LVSPRILTFSVDRPVGESGKTSTVRANPAPVTPSAWGRSALARSWQIAPADVAPSASAQVVRGAVARHSGLPSAARILATSSRPPAASFAVKTRPPCALLPLPGQPRPTGLGTPVPPFVPLSPVLPRQASGWHPLRRGGSVAPTLHLRWIVLGATPTPALSVFLRFRRRCGSQRREPTKPSFGHDPSFPLVRKCLGGLRTGISFRVLLAVAVRLPALSLRSPLQLMPPLRPPQAAADFSQWCFVKVSRFIGAHPSHSSAPRLHPVFVPHTAFQPTVPPPGAWRKALSSSLPALPHSFLVCAAWSLLRDRLTPRPAAARGSYRLFR
jgi:hypothetical protein